MTGRAETSEDAFAALAAEAIDALPEVFAGPAREVVIQIADWPPEDILRAMGIADRRDLTGLYEGIPLTEKSSFDQPHGADMIWLFREPILAEWRDRGDVELGDLVGHVLVHELAHHFGWSDADIALIDRWWE